MAANLNRVHEPDVPLLEPEELQEDYHRLRALYHRPAHGERSISLHVPLWVVIEAIDELDPPALRNLAQHIAERLMIVES
ncbi:MAG: hypothetical protein IT331_03315 [Anaerolineae bacterium]|nr:hypothetical protein [Anaerolineae bacterium]